MEKGLSGLRGRDFELSDVFYFSKKGLEAIVEDEVTQRFSSEELVSWNLLTRTNVNFQYISLRLTMVWVLGVLVRYCVLLPLRVTLAFFGISLLVLGTTLVGQLPDSSLKNRLSELVHLTCCRICVRALSGTINYHNKQYRPQKGGICVANHTSPIDVLILTTDGCYAMVRAADWSFSSCVVEIAQMVYFGTNRKVSSHWLFSLYCCSCYRIYLHQEYIG